MVIEKIITMMKVCEGVRGEGSYFVGDLGDEDHHERVAYALDEVQRGVFIGV